MINQEISDTRIKEEYFNYLLKQLINATAKIVQGYFKLSVANYHEQQIFRERVYCYELYHQLRFFLGSEFHYSINGEVDKTGHSFIKGEFKPDFIVHVPGTMEKNLAVIEVKTIGTENTEIQNDIEKFKVFLKARYYKAIMLIYGDDVSKVEYARKEIDSSPKYSKRILLLWHKIPGSKAEEYSHARTT